MSCVRPEGHFKECSEREGAGLADSVETLGVDLRTRKRTREQGAKEKARMRKCDEEVAIAKTNHVFQKNQMRAGVMKLLRVGLVPARVRGRQAIGISPTERLKWRRQMAATAGLEVNIPEVEDEVSTLATLGRRSLAEKMEGRARQSAAKADDGGRNAEASERACRSYQM